MILVSAQFKESLWNFVWYCKVKKKKNPKKQPREGVVCGKEKERENKSKSYRERDSQGVLCEKIGKQREES